MTPRPISELVHRHIGRPGVAIGGGISLPWQYERVSHFNAVHVAANQHAHVMGYRFDYVVAVDPDMPAKLREFGKPVISMATRRKHADYLIFSDGFNQSGVEAARVLWLMGCVPILPIGIDCFKGGTYCHDEKAKSSGTGSSVEQHLRKWQKLKDVCRGAAFRSMGGPLDSLFPRYDPEETRFTIPSREDLLREVCGVIVEVRDPRDFLAGRRIGERVECSKSEARHAVTNRFAVKVAGELPA